MDIQKFATSIALQIVDFWNTYYEFLPSHTNDIDYLLMTTKGTRLSHMSLSPNGQEKPGTGYHYYYDDGGYYITFQKKKVGDPLEYVYRCAVWTMWEPDRYRAVYREFNRKLFATESSEIETMYISTSNYKTEVISLRKKYSAPKEKQLTICKTILEDFQSNGNSAALLLGEPGTGKSYTARVLKKELERQYPCRGVLLFDNFNPSAPGVDIVAIALQKARNDTTVIIVIDEIEQHFNHALNSSPNAHGKTTHTDSKQSLNGLLDTIRSVRGVIFIATSNLTHTKMEQDYHVFTRQGRIDSIYEVHQNDAQLLRHPTRGKK